MLKRGLTENQSMAMRIYLAREIAGQPPPTVREIMKELGWTSSATAWKVIEQLREKGLLSKAQGKHNATRLLSPPSNMDRMCYLWERSSPEERREFIARVGS